MTIPRRSPLHDFMFSAQIVDISTADNVSIPMPISGELVYWTITLEAVITGTAAMTVEINGTAAAGAAQSLVALAAKTPQKKVVPDGVTVTEGDNLEFITDGNSTNTSLATIVAVIRQT